MAPFLSKIGHFTRVLLHLGNGNDTVASAS